VLARIMGKRGSVVGKRSREPIRVSLETGVLECVGDVDCEIGKIAHWCSAKQKISQNDLSRVMKGV
jgi:hypothetical protein